MQGIGIVAQGLKNLSRRLHLRFTSLRGGLLYPRLGGFMGLAQVGRPRILSVKEKERVNTQLLLSDWGRRRTNN